MQIWQVENLRTSPRYHNMNRTFPKCRLLATTALAVLAVAAPLWGQPLSLAGPTVGGDIAMASPGIEEPSKDTLESTEELPAPVQPGGSPERESEGFEQLPFSPQPSGENIDPEVETETTSPLKPSPSPFAPEVEGDFPALPPPPGESAYDDLPELQEELLQHGGSYLYRAEGDQLNAHGDHHGHGERLRLPEGYQKPRPLTMFSEFLGADPIQVTPGGRWPGLGGYAFDKRLVIYGNYSLFGFVLEQNNRRQDILGHNLMLDLDYRVTGTERIHIQYRPIGRKNTGGSYYQFSNPEGYVSNHTAIPDRFWAEGEVNSVLGAHINPFRNLNLHVVGGKFPFQLHNSLLLSDDILGAAVSKNTIYWGKTSNMNVQAFIGADVDRPNGANNTVFGTHVSIDRRHAFYEGTYAFLNSNNIADAHYLALSRTQFYGPYTFTVRGMARLDGNTQTSGELLVLEANRRFVFDHKPLGIEHSVAFLNAFYVDRGWSPISGGNFNRLRTAFEVNPLVSIAAGQINRDRFGIALGAQLFRNHENESLTPEFAYEAPDGTSVFGFGMRYQRKTGKRTFLELLGVINFSADDRFDREGIFAAHTLLF